MSFRFANVGGRSALVDDDGRWYDAERVSNGAVSADPMSAWLRCADLHDAASRLSASAPDGVIGDADLRPPIPSPRSVFAVGLNYRSHAEESSMELPGAPLVFTKFSSCLVGPRDDVVLGGSTDDYEAELVVVIGDGGRDISPEDAWAHVGGVTIGQDISDRALQFAAEPAHFDLGKSRDTYGPIGPVVVSTDSFDDPDDLSITCDVNGERRQDDRTSNLIFDVPTLVSYLSGILTLRPGDLLFTGTPEGVGAASLRFLGDGDVITTTIEGIGTMTNHCRVPT
ncbi:MAG: fumarylacetoacetate hydrolase family protein [Acidimicrobiales bacterium]|jgi:2-keto-4-pentenoate hydratase/2-oxohepta-3-ene-1,7-dioic acid hydratase in catechol pathway